MAEVLASDEQYEEKLLHFSANVKQEFLAGKHSHYLCCFQVVMEMGNFILNSDEEGGQGE